MDADSLLLKGWTVTLVTALFAFSSNEADDAPRRLVDGHGRVQGGRDVARALASKTFIGFYLPVAGLLAKLSVYFVLSPKTPPVPV